MRILQVNKFHYRKRGAETYFFDVVQLLRSNGHTVETFAMEHPSNESATYQDLFVPNVELQDPSQQSFGNRIHIAKNMLWNRQAAKRFELVIQQFRPDIIHIHNIYHQISPSILPVAKRYGIPVVMTLHDYKLLAPNYNLIAQGQIDESSKGGKYYKAFFNKAIQNSYAASAICVAEQYLHKWLQVYENNVDVFISPSRFLADLVRNWHIQVKHIQVLPNFLYADQVTPHYESGAYLLYAGGLSVEKGIDTLLDALAQTQYDARLLIAGSGPMQSALHKQVQTLQLQDRVEFLGHLSQTALQSIMSKSLAVVMPSRCYDNYPYATLEAFAAGKPVIAANLGGLPEQVTPGKTGWLYTPGNSSELASVIDYVTQQAREHHAEIEAIGKYAREWVEIHANPEQHYKKLISIYENLLA